MARFSAAGVTTSRTGLPPRRAAQPGDRRRDQTHPCRCGLPCWPGDRDLATPARTGPRDRASRHRGRRRRPGPGRWGVRAGGRRGSAAAERAGLVLGGGGPAAAGGDPPGRAGRRRRTTGAGALRARRGAVAARRGPARGAGPAGRRARRVRPGRRRRRRPARRRSPGTPRCSSPTCWRSPAGRWTATWPPRSPRSNAPSGTTEGSGSSGYPSPRRSRTGSEGNEFCVV